MRAQIARIDVEVACFDRHDPIEGPGMRAASLGALQGRRLIAGFFNVRLAHLSHASMGIGNVADLGTGAMRAETDVLHPESAGG